MEKVPEIEELLSHQALPPHLLMCCLKMKQQNNGPTKYSIISRLGLDHRKMRTFVDNLFKVLLMLLMQFFPVTITSEDKRTVESKGIRKKVLFRKINLRTKYCLRKSFAKCSAQNPGANGSPREETKRIESDANCQADALRVLDIGSLGKAIFFHDDPGNFTDIGGGVAGVQGLHSSFRLTEGGFSLNMDVSTTVILKPGPVIDFLLSNQNVREPRYIDWAKAKKVLKNLRVLATPRNWEFKISGLSEKPCIQQLFSMKVKSGNNNSGEQTVDITVYEYFAKHCGIELTSSAYLPCLDVGKPNRPNYLPLERYTKALSPMQRASLMEKSRQKPQDRIKILTNAVGNYCYDDDPVLGACGISVDKQLTPVEGRVLETPKLKIGKNEDCFPHNGRWSFNKKTLLKPSHIDFWAVVNFSARCDTSYITRELIKCGMSKGIMFDLLISKLTKEPKLILCVLPERKNCDIYGPWKKKCLSEFGVVTQCISPLKITDQYLTNVLLKINSKLGGINSLLTIEHSGKLPLIKDTPTMILGMDVSHGSPGQLDIPSIAAVVGSRRWPLISRYRASVRTQSSKVEIIDALYTSLWIMGMMMCCLVQVSTLDRDLDSQGSVVVFFSTHESLEHYGSMVDGVEDEKSVEKEVR
ncbi:Ribonuclease H-like superfamily [Sesbania bispinosa]|nr:Ribonuclease H-like superfamily [Sesbania bispinosa]